MRCRSWLESTRASMLRFLYERCSTTQPFQGWLARLSRHKRRGRAPFHAFPDDLSLESSVLRSGRCWGAALHEGRRLPRMEPAKAIGDVSTFPASYAQQRLWFLDQLEPATALYNVPAAFRLRGRLDVGALERSLNEIVQRHEALRTTFDSRDGEALQVVHSHAVCCFLVIDLSQLPEELREK